MNVRRRGFTLWETALVLAVLGVTLVLAAPAIVDFGANKPLSDALRFGVPTWCLVFNRAIGSRSVAVAPWCTREMINIAHGPLHGPLVQSIRKLAKLFPPVQPAVVGQTVILECHPLCGHDDNAAKLKEKIK